MLPSEIKLPVGVGVEGTKWLSHRAGSRLPKSGNGSYRQQEELLGTYFLINESSGAAMLAVTLWRPRGPSLPTADSAE